MSVGAVHFTPCARTGWHVHSIGQTLFVTEGEGRVPASNGPVHVIRPGDVVRLATPVWTATELRAFLDFVRSDRLYPMFRLLAMTGVRRGEACGLRWHDVDLE